MLSNYRVIRQKHIKQVHGNSGKLPELSTLGTDSVDGAVILMAATDTICNVDE